MPQTTISNILESNLYTAYIAYRLYHMNTEIHSLWALQRVQWHSQP